MPSKLQNNLRRKVLEAFSEHFPGVETWQDAREIHYTRNANQLPGPRYAEVVSGNFEHQAVAASAFHRLDVVRGEVTSTTNGPNSQNSKWEAAGGHAEYVYRYVGTAAEGQFELVDSSLNRGTFNFSPKDDSLFGKEHLALDVDPWILWGNDPEDARTWTTEERKEMVNLVDFLVDKIKEPGDVHRGSGKRDTVSYARSEHAVTVNLQKQAGFDGDARGDTYRSIESIVGSRAGDIIVGSTKANKLDGGGGRDILKGLGDNDTLLGGNGDDTLDGGGNDDDLRGGNGNDSLSGGSGRDALRGAKGDDTLYGGNHADLLVGGRGGDYMIGGDGPDQLYGGADRDILVGSRGRDELFGGDGRDVADYSRADDEGEGTGIVADLKKGFVLDQYGDRDRLIEIEEIHGTAYDDVFRGSSETNWFIGLRGNDTFIGRGTDEDRVHYYNDHHHGGTQGIVADLEVGQVQDTFGDTDTLKSIEAISGSVFDDRIVGKSGWSWLYGSDGNDTLLGGSGSGGMGGGRGRDVLKGQGGFDYFAFFAVDDSPVGGGDVIRDFGADDMLVFKENLAWVTYVEGAEFSGRAGEIRHEARGRDVYFLGDVDGDAVADLEIRLVKAAGLTEFTVSIG